MKLEFWFEFASTYSWLGVERVESLCRDAGRELVWRPFLLGPIFRDQGWNDSPFNLYPAKGVYMWRDMERRCKARGLSLRRPSQFPRNGLLAARVATAARDEPWLADFVRGVYRANFSLDLDISDPGVVASRVDESGSRGEDWLERAGSDETKALLRERTERARDLGIFGAPSCVVDGELFWGDDRLEEAVGWQST